MNVSDSFKIGIDIFLSLWYNNCMEREDLQKDKLKMQDDLLPEYDLKQLRVRGVGPGRKSFGGKPIIQLEPDVAKIFPDDAAVNEALRFLIRVTKEM